MVWVIRGQGAGLTCLPCVDHKAGVGEGGGLNEAVAVGFDSSGVSDLGLDHIDGDGAVGDVPAVLQDADLVFAHLPGDEGDACEGNGRESATCTSSMLEDKTILLLTDAIDKMKPGLLINAQRHSKGENNVEKKTLLNNNSKTL